MEEQHECRRGRAKRQHATTPPKPPALSEFLYTKKKGCKHNPIEKFPCHGKRIKWLPRCCRCTEPRASGKAMCGPLHDAVFRGLHRARRWKLPLRPSFGYAFSTFSSSTAMSADYCLLFLPTDLLNVMHMARMR